MIDISHAKELELGRISYQQALRNAQLQGHAILPPNHPSAVLVRSVGQRIAAATGLNLPWEFTVVASPQVNAFCSPGGKVVVYSGLLQARLLLPNPPSPRAILAAVRAARATHQRIALPRRGRAPRADSHGRARARARAGLRARRGRGGGCRGARGTRRPAPPAPRAAATRRRHGPDSIARLRDKALHEDQRSVLFSDAVTRAGRARCGAARRRAAGLR